MEPQKEIEYLREKVALLEKCLEYERLLRDMREAAPKEPVYVPHTYPVAPWAVPYDPTRLTWEPGLTTTGGPSYPTTPWNENTYAMPCVGHGGVTIC